MTGVQTCALPILTSLVLSAKHSSACQTKITSTVSLTVPAAGQGKHVNGVEARLGGGLGKRFGKGFGESGTPDELHGVSGE